MSASLRVVDTGVEPSRWNIAVTAALLELHRAGGMPDTIRFHRYPRSVLIGRHQELGREVDIEACRRGGIEIARRVSGGGAIYMSPAVLAWDLVCGRRRFGAELEGVSSRVGTVIADGLRRLGLSAVVNTTGGVEIDGRKVSGSSGSFDGTTLLMQGTILIDFDRAEMSRVLRAQTHVMGPAPRVGGLADFLGRVPGVEEVRSALLMEMSEAWRVPLTIESLGAEEFALADALLASEIGTEAFVLGELADAAPPATSLQKGASA